VSPAIETFGTHRLIFGSCPGVPIAALSKADHEETSVEQIVPSAEWYAVLRKCFAELGEDEEAMTGLMGGNAQSVYDLF